MSLINRMLRDLSSRQPGPNDVMNGIEVPREGRPPGGAVQRLGLLVLLVAAFTGGFWFMFGPKQIAVPQPRGSDAGTTAAAAAPAGAPAPAVPATPDGAAPAAPATTNVPASIASSAPPTKLKIDTDLTEPAARPAPARAPAKTARSSVQRAAPTADSTGPAAARAPAAANADELYAKARRALERGDEAAAEALLNDALAANPQLHVARADLGNLRIGQNRLEEAETLARAGLELDPAYVGYRRLVARIELARNRPAAAVAALERDAPPLERDLEYQALLASAYQRVNRHEDASRLYRELVRVQPQEANWWAGYAMSRDALGDVAGALAAYAQARQVGGLAPNVLEHINRRSATLQAQD